MNCDDGRRQVNESNAWGILGFSLCCHVLGGRCQPHHGHPTTPPPHIHPTDFGIISTRMRTFHLHKIFQALEWIRGDITVERGRISDENMWPGERGLEHSVQSCLSNAEPALRPLRRWTRHTFYWTPSPIPSLLGTLSTPNSMSSLAGRLLDVWALRERYIATVVF